MSTPGLFVSFEGIDGSGKSTQARLLAETLRGTGREVVLTREPGGSEGAEEIRRLLLTGDPARWSAETEILLFTAARRDHLERTIEPALARGAVVVTDRFADSTRLYQGTARGHLRGLVDRLHAMMVGLEPDLTFVIDVDPDLARARDQARGSAEDRFERMGSLFQARLREGFLRLAHEDPARVAVIDGNVAEAEVARAVAVLALSRLGP